MRKYYFGYHDVGGYTLLAATLTNEKGSIGPAYSNYGEVKFENNNYSKTLKALKFAAEELKEYVVEHGVINEDIIILNQNQFFIDYLAEGKYNYKYAEYVEDTKEVLVYLAENYGITVHLDLVDKNMNLAKKSAERYSKTSEYRERTEGRSSRVTLDLGTKKVEERKVSNGDNVVNIRRDGIPF